MESSRPNSKQTQKPIAYVVFDEPEKAGLYTRVLKKFEYLYQDLTGKSGNLFSVYENQDTLDKLAETSLSNKMKIIYVIESPEEEIENPYNYYNEKRLGNLLSQKNFPQSSNWLMILHLTNIKISDVYSFSFLAQSLNTSRISYWNNRTTSKNEYIKNMQQISDSQKAKSFINPDFYFYVNNFGDIVLLVNFDFNFFVKQLDPYNTGLFSKK